MPSGMFSLGEENSAETRQLQELSAGVVQGVVSASLSLRTSHLLLLPASKNLGKIYAINTLSSPLVVRPCAALSGLATSVLREPWTRGFLRAASASHFERPKQYCRVYWKSLHRYVFSSCKPLWTGKDAGMNLAAQTGHSKQAPVGAMRASIP
jgi:hypothetical protein